MPSPSTSTPSSRLGRRRSPLHLLALCLALALLAAVPRAALAQSSTSAATDSDPIGPLTTNNAQSACVQYGDCTTLPSSNTYTTATQNGPVTAPASTTKTAAPTNSAESAASLSDLASTGAGAAYSSTVTGKDADTSVATATSSSTLTGTVMAYTSSGTTSATVTSGGENNAAGGAVRVAWPALVVSSLAVVGITAGASMVFSGAAAL